MQKRKKRKNIRTKLVDAFQCVTYFYNIILIFLTDFFHVKSSGAPFFIYIFHSISSTVCFNFFNYNNYPINRF